MSEQETFAPDRSGWPAGPWDAEGDREDWVDETTGLPCFIQRNRLGAWCGYVGVPPGHPDHGKDYDDVDVSVHGGLTYADECHGHLCHVPAPGQPEDVWWFGFDCLHAWDRAPGMDAANLRIEMPTRPTDIYRDAVYAKAETTSLAQQLAAPGRKG